MKCLKRDDDENSRRAQQSFFVVASDRTAVEDPFVFIRLSSRGLSIEIPRIIEDTKSSARSFFRTTFTSWWSARVTGMPTSFFVLLDLRQSQLMFVLRSFIEARSCPMLRCSC